MISKDFFKKVREVSHCADSIIKLCKSENLDRNDAFTVLRNEYLRNDFLAFRNLKGSDYHDIINKHYGFEYKFETLLYFSSKRFLCAKISKHHLENINFVPNSETSMVNKFFYFLDKTDFSRLTNFLEENSCIKVSNFAKNVKNDNFLSKVSLLSK